MKTRTVEVILGLGAVAGAILVLGAVGLSTPRPVRLSGAGCTYSSWSVPKRLSRLAPGIMLSRPTLAISEAGSYVVGTRLPRSTNVPLFRQRVEVNPLTVLATDGESIGRPVGNHWFMHPRAVVDGKGRLHVIWGEPQPVRLLMFPEYLQLANHTKSLWYAQYDPRRGWTQPRVVYRPEAAGPEPLDVPPGTLAPVPKGSLDDVRWNSDLPLALDSDGGIHTVFGAMTPGVLVHLVGRNGNWHPDTIVRARILYADIAARGPNDLYVSFIGRRPGVDRSGSELLFMRSSDGGASWSSPVEIAELGSNHASQPRVLIGPEQSLHVVWGQSLSGGTFPEVVRHILSRDGGRTWSQPDSVTLPRSFAWWSTAVDRCGVLHLLFRTDRERYYTRWDGTWAAPVDPLPGFPAIRDLTIQADSDGSEILLFGSTPARSTRDSLPALDVFTSRIRVTQRDQAAG